MKPTRLLHTRFSLSFFAVETFIFLPPLNVTDWGFRGPWCDIKNKEIKGKWKTALLMAAQWKHCQRSVRVGTLQPSLCFIAFFHIRRLCFYRLLSLALFPHLSQINKGELCSGNTNAQGDAGHL